MYGENEPAIKKNEAALNNLLGQLAQQKLMTKIPDNCKYPLTLIQGAQNQKKSSTGGSSNFIKLTFGAKVVLTLSKDIKIV